MVTLPDRPLSAPGRPKHVQLREALEALIAEELKPGDMLPSERSLERTYGVSRITVRRAIGDLTAAGRLYRVRGKGTFVALNPLVSRPHLASFSSEMGARDIAASSRILLSGRACPPAPVVSWFGTPPEEPHIRLRRLRLGNNEPYSIDDAWYNARLVPDLLENDVYNSVYTILERRYDLRIDRATQSVSAVAATPGAATLLGVEPGTPLLSVRRLSQAGQHRVELCSSVYRPDRYRLEATIARALDERQP